MKEDWADGWLFRLIKSMSGEQTANSTPVKNSPKPFNGKLEARLRHHKLSQKP